MRFSLRVALVWLITIIASVKEDRFSRMTRIYWPASSRTSAWKYCTTTSGLTVVEYWNSCFGRILDAWQGFSHVSNTFWRVDILSNMKHFLDHCFFIWEGFGWLSLTCRAFAKVKEKGLGTTMSSSGQGWRGICLRHSTKPLYKFWCMSCQTGVE